MITVVFFSEQQGFSKQLHMLGATLHGGKSEILKRLQNHSFGEVLIMFSRYLGVAMVIVHEVLVSKE